MSYRRRLLGLLLVGSAVAGFSACDGPGSDWPKDGPSGATSTAPQNPSDDSSTRKVDAGLLDAGMGTTRCSPLDAGGLDTDASGTKTNDAGAALTPDSGCR